MVNLLGDEHPASSSFDLGNVEHLRARKHMEKKTQNVVMYIVMFVIVVIVPKI